MKCLMYAISIVFMMGGMMHAAGDAQAVPDSAIAVRGKAATALIEVTGEGSFGSGFCIDSSGTLITNCHVVGRARDSVKVIFAPGETTQKICYAKVVKVDEGLDLALLKLTGANPFSAVEFGVDENLSELDEVVAFGFPFGKELAFNARDY